MAEHKAAILLFVFSLLVFQQGRINCALWSQGFRVFRTEAELEEFKQLNPRERLDAALKFPASEILEITGANQAATVQEGVSLNINCLPWLRRFPEGSSIQWYSTQLDEIGNPILGEQRIPENPPPPDVPSYISRITVGGEFNQWLNISRVELVGGAEDPDSKLFECEVCTARDTPLANCSTAKYTNLVIGGPPVIKETNVSRCLHGANAAQPGDKGGIVLFETLDCTVSFEVPRPIPPPTVTWFRNGEPAASATHGESFTLNMSFLTQFPILTPGVFSQRGGIEVPAFQVLVNGQLIFTTEFGNISDPMLGNLTPGTTLREARATLFDILLANWTCAANNSLGTDAVEHNIRMCVPQSSIPVPEVEGLCSVVVWDSGLSDLAVSCEDIIGFDVRLYHPESKHQNLTRRVETDETYYKIDDEGDESNIDHETHVQVRVVHKYSMGRWSEGTSIGCERPTEIPSGLYFELNGRIYPNNSAIPLRDIGVGDSALLCKTDRKDCCGTRPNRYGEFYYPNGIAVPIASRLQGFYRNRGEQQIRLNRRSTATSPTGKYRCAIPEVDGEIQSIYVTLTEWSG